MYHDSWNKRKGTVAALAAGIALFSLASPAHAKVNAATCKQKIANAAATFERNKLKALKACENNKRTGKYPPTTVCLTETLTARAIAGYQATLTKTISTNCAGLSLTQIGWDGSGSGGNPVLAKTCSAGKLPGVGCGRETECPGVCVGGGKDDESCTFNSSCANRRCEHAKCIGGTQNSVDCSNETAKAACEAGSGVCNWLNGCDGGSGSTLGTCVGGTSPNKNCFADSDCSGGGTCDSGCGTGNQLDCQAGVCQGAMCASAKDCGFCQTGSPNQNQSCAADTDCGKVCSNNANKPCKAAGDCPGGACNTIASSCTLGSCSGGFCSPTSGLAVAGDARLSPGLCQAVDRCPAFESNKLLTVKTCDGGTKNGQSCASDTDCTGGGTCKNGCDFALSSAADVTSCLACIGEASVDQINQSVYGQMKPATYHCVGGTNDQMPCTLATAATDCPTSGTGKGACKLSTNDTAVESCKQGLGKATAAFFDSKRNYLEQCEERIFNGRAVSCPDATAQRKITGVANTFLTAVASACAGKDKAFGDRGRCSNNLKQACLIDTDCGSGNFCRIGGSLNLDALPDNIGNLFTCPNVTVPNGGPACGGTDGRKAINTLDDLAECIQCLTEFKVDCTDRIAVPATGAVFPECNPLCGNGKIDGHCSVTTGTTCGSTLDCPSGETCIPIETCDDGNSVSGDTCPSNCVIQSCTPSGSTEFALITFDAPIGADLAAMSVYVEYPDGTVSIPGRGNDQSVQDSLTVPFDAYSSINDLDYAARITLVGNSAMFPGVVAVVQFDRCTGAPKATNDQFRCAVESAADTSSNTVSGVSCSVTVF
jgi:hypothetical protein